MDEDTESCRLDRLAERMFAGAERDETSSLLGNVPSYC